MREKCYTFAYEEQNESDDVERRRMRDNQILHVWKWWECHREYDIEINGLTLVMLIIVYLLLSTEKDGWNTQLARWRRRIENDDDGLYM